PPCPTTPEVPPRPNAVEAVVAGQRLRFVFRASRMANLLYELDCMSGLTPCSEEAFRTWWKLDADDEAALRTWKEVHRRYSGHIEQQGVSQEGLVLPGPQRSVESRMSIAGYRADSV